MNGQKIEILTKFGIPITNDNDILTANRIIKFDGSAVEPILYEDGTKYRIRVSHGKMKFDVYYLTKKDGTNWKNREEMRDTNVEDLVLYDNIADVPENSVIVAMYFESNSGSLAVSSGDMNDICVPIIVKDSAKIGTTYPFIQRTQMWEEKLDRSIYTIKNKGNFTYPKANYDSGNVNYIKTEYDENGQKIAGTHSGGANNGQTLLIIGANLSVTIDAINEEGETKVNYDIGQGYCDVTYKIIPKVENAIYEDIEAENIVLKIEDTLPQGMTYVPNSTNSIYGEPEIIANEDGTTKLIWKLYNVKAGEIEPIVYKAHINEAIGNGISLENKVVISEEPQTDAEGNKIYKVGNNEIKNRTATKAIQTIDLQSYRLYKRTDTEIIEKDGEIRYKISFRNSTTSKVEDFVMLDVMPYNGDERGTSYTGEYTIESATISQKDLVGNPINTSNLELFTTKDNNVSNITVKDENIGVSNIWNKVDEIDGKYNINLKQTNEEKTGIAVKGEVGEQTEVIVEIVVKTEGNRSKDKYVNTATCQVSKATTELGTTDVVSQVIEREINGKVWKDTNYNGVIDEGEGLPSEMKDEIKLKLYKVKEEEKLEEIRETVLDEEGKYAFKELEAGEYVVKVEYNGNKYWLTAKEIGADERINNKFEEEKNGVGKTGKITKLNSNLNLKLEQGNVNVGLSEGEFNLSVEKRVKEIKVNEEGYGVGKGKKVRVNVEKEDEEGKEKTNEVKMVYSIVVKNTESIPGKARIEENIPEIGNVEYIESESSSKWRQEEGKLVTEVELNAGESEELIVVLKWEGKKENFGTIKNNVKIEAQNSVGKEEKNVRDNEDEAKVTITSKLNLPITGGTGILISVVGIAVIAGGVVILIKKKKQNKQNEG